MSSATPPISRLPTQARQAEIITAALRLVQDRSPAGITTTDLAQALGLSQGALFKHFSSKEAIWLGVMAWVSEHLLGELQRAADQAPAPMAALQAVFDAHVAFVVAYPGVPRVIFHELQQAQDSVLKQQVRALMHSYRQLLLGLLQSAVQSGEAASGLDIAAAATLFVGIVQGLVMQSMLSGQIASMREQAPVVFQLYARSLRSTP